MSEKQVYELLSDLGIALRLNGTKKKKPTRAETDIQDLQTSSSPSLPQATIYTRKPQDDYGITSITENVKSQLGHEAREFLDEPAFWLKGIHPDDAPAIFSGFPKLLDSGNHVQEYRFLHKDGTYRWIRDHWIMIRDDQGSPFEIAGCWIDVTEQKRVEDTLRKTVLRYRSLVDSSPVGMVSFDTRGEITEFNPAVLQILGAPFGEATDPKYLFTYLPVMEAGISEAILHCMESGKAGVGEYQYKSKKERQVCTRLHVTPVHNGESNISGIHAFIEDISDQKRAEELIVKSERLKVLGQMARGLGYNFNNLLQVVSGSADMALTGLDMNDMDAVRNNLKQILESAQSATETVKWLHQFGRTPKTSADSQKELFDFSELVEEAVEICKFWSRAELERTGAQIKYDVSLKKDCLVEGIPDQISWVALNILKNAVEALPNGGRIKVKTYIDENLAILRVEDNGVGIKLEEINNLTQAFWTSKDGHAGMGLTFNSEIIRRHKGKMGIKRMKPHGTCFVVRLPGAIDKRKNGQPHAEEMSERGFRILLIEDDERVLRILEEGLKLLGQQPICAMSVEEGLKILHQSEVDAVVCELAMPDKSGWEAAAAVREVFREKNVPKAPFIALMGYAAPEQDEVDPSTGVDRVLAKPIKVPQLLEIITQEIGKESAGGAFSGKVDRIDLLEYVQLLLLNGRRIVLEVASTEGMKGHIFVDRGEILHAICGDLRGEDALYKCLTFKSGTFSTLPWQEPEEVTINRSAMFLLVEAARKKDDMRFKLIQARESNRRQVARDLGAASTVIIK